MDRYALWMKRDGLYTSGVVGSEIIHMGYVKQELCMSKKTLRCLKQLLDVLNNVEMHNGQVPIF